MGIPYVCIDPKLSHMSRNMSRDMSHDSTRITVCVVYLMHKVCVYQLY